MARGRTRERPNILIMETPRTGKTTTCRSLAEATGLRYVNVDDLVKDNKLHNGWDDRFDCFIIDEEMIEVEMKEGGNIVDYHGCDFFPERWFDRVIVLQTETPFCMTVGAIGIGYGESKLKNSIECEIFQVLLEEARDYYHKEIISALQSNTIEEMEGNVASLVDCRYWGSASR